MRLSNASPKIETLVVLKLWTPIFSSKNHVWDIRWQYLIALKKIFPTMYFMPQLEIIWPMFYRDLWLKIKFPIWFLTFLDHNSCILGLNEQCEGTLGIYTSRPFQWCSGGPIWCLFSFSTKVLNTWDSHTNATPKMRMHLRIVGFHLFHSPPFVRVCFTFKHIILTSWALAFYI
jgi:hypothetical protein